MIETERYNCFHCEFYFRDGFGCPFTACIHPLTFTYHDGAKSKITKEEARMPWMEKL